MGANRKIASDTKTHRSRDSTNTNQLKLIGNHTKLKALFDLELDLKYVHLILLMDSTRKMFQTQDRLEMT